jgi:hypothetical protein
VFASARLALRKRPTGQDGRGPKDIPNISPCEPTLVDRPLAGPGWLHSKVLIRRSSSSIAEIESADSNLRWLEGVAVSRTRAHGETYDDERLEERPHHPAPSRRSLSSISDRCSVRTRRSLRAEATKSASISTHRLVGGFKRSSQHDLCRLIGETGHSVQSAPVRGAWAAPKWDSAWDRTAGSSKYYNNNKVVRSGGGVFRWHLSNDDPRLCHGGGYVNLAIELGVPKDRIDTVTDFAPRAAIWRPMPPTIPGCVKTGRAHNSLTCSAVAQARQPVTAGVLFGVALAGGEPSLARIFRNSPSQNCRQCPHEHTATDIARLGTDIVRKG